MKKLRFLAFVLTVVLCGQIVHAEDMDTAITKLTEDVATKIKENGNKKVTVLDLTDLQGDSSELGKYIAEQLTVDFTMVKRDFSVLDRANLKRILAEHKLDASGLVNPENAKKLGMFSGVDAMIFGTITPVGKSINVTVKVISIETAEVVGSAKAKFDSDDTVQQLLSQPAKADNASASDGATKPAPKPKPFGDLDIKVDSFQINTGDEYAGFVNYSLTITNTSASDTYGVAMKAAWAGTASGDLSIKNSRGDEFRVDQMDGIECVTEMSGGGVMGKLTEMLPSTSIVITGKSTAPWRDGKPGDYRPYRLQAMMFFGLESQGRYSDIKKRNLVLDIK
jgi:hypothetical protein